MTRKLVKAGALGLAVLFGGQAAQAATVHIFTTTQNPQETRYGIRDETTTDGHDLIGSRITAIYADGSSEEVIWESRGTYGRGGATGTGIDLYKQAGALRITSTQLLASLFFDLAPASSVFDISVANEGGAGNTPTSLIGSPFRIRDTGSDPVEGRIDVTYSGIVSLAGQPAAGDLFTAMRLDFTGLSGGGLLGTLSTGGDMDTLRYAGDLSPVPLPGSLPVLMGGMGALAFLRRRKRKSATTL